MRRLIFNVSGQKIETNSNCGNSWKGLKKAARFVGEDGLEHASVVPAEVLDGAYFKVGDMGDMDDQQIVTGWVTIDMCRQGSIFPTA